jgi:hypothetical protein
MMIFHSYVRHNQRVASLKKKYERLSSLDDLRFQDVPDEDPPAAAQLSSADQKLWCNF